MSEPELVLEGWRQICFWAVGTFAFWGWVYYRVARYFWRVWRSIHD